MKEPELDIINGMPEDNRDWTFYPSVRYFFRTSYISAVDVSSLQRGIILRICDRVSPVLVAYAKSFKACSRTHGDPNVEDTRVLEPLLSSSIIGVDGDFDRVGICVITIGVEHMNNPVQKRRGIHSGGGSIWRRGLDRAKYSSSRLCASRRRSRVCSIPQISVPPTYGKNSYCYMLWEEVKKVFTSPIAEKESSGSPIGLATA